VFFKYKITTLLVTNILQHSAEESKSCTFCEWWWENGDNKSKIIHWGFHKST